MIWKLYKKDIQAALMFLSGVAHLLLYGKCDHSSGQVNQNVSGLHTKWGNLSSENTVVLPSSLI